MEKEIEFLGGALDNPKRPFVAILGGAKISDKITVIENLLSKADTLLIGGGMANTFLKAKGYEMADSLVEEGAVATAAELMAKAGDRLLLPVDVVVADAFSADAQKKTIAADAVEPGWRVLDIGPKTAAAYAAQGAGRRHRGVERPHGRVRDEALCRRHLCRSAGAGRFGGHHHHRRR